MTSSHFPYLFIYLALYFIFWVVICANFGFVVAFTWGADLWNIVKTYKELLNLLAGFFGNSKIKAFIFVFALNLTKLGWTPRTWKISCPWWLMYISFVMMLGHLDRRVASSTAHVFFAWYHHFFIVRLFPGNFFDFFNFF